jgi:hypothetical protein
MDESVEQVNFSGNGGELMRNGAHWVALCAVALGLSAEGAFAATLWGGGILSHSLYTIDSTTGARATVETFGTDTFAGINGLAYNSSDHFLYATTYADFVSPSNPSPPNQTLYRIDPVTHSVTGSLMTGLPLQLNQAIDGLEYDSLRNVFWGTIPSRNELVSIDPQTFAATVHGTFSRYSWISGLAYDHQTDTLYGVDDPGTSPTLSRLVKIDVSTLGLTDVGSPGLGQSLRDLDSLAFDPMDRVLYSIHDLGSTPGPPYTQQLLRIDPATGIATLVGPHVPPMDFENYQGLAIIVPEMPTAILALILCLGLMAFRNGVSFSPPIPRPR